MQQEEKINTQNLQEKDHLEDTDLADAIILEMYTTETTFPVVNLTKLPPNIV
jgi:hypothetical protein